MKVRLDKPYWCYYCGGYKMFYRSSNGTWICKTCGQPH